MRRGDCGMRPARPARMWWPLIGPLLLCALLCDGVALVAQEGAWVAPERRARQPNPLPSSDENIALGRQLYARECTPCHGQTGANDGPKRPKDMSAARRHTDPALWDETDGALFWKIAEGRGSMPSTLDVLNDRERWLVVIYLRTLAPRPADPRSNVLQGAARPGKPSSPRGR